MTFIPSKLNVLNYPIETEEAKKFWASKHKCNQVKSIIAFSLNEENANDNLRRYGYTYQWRKKALAAFGHFVNHPTMKDIPFTETSTPYWECMPANASTPPVPPPVDKKKWVLQGYGENRCFRNKYPEFHRKLPVVAGDTIEVEFVWRGDETLTGNDKFITFEGGAWGFSVEQISGGKATAKFGGRGGAVGQCVIDGTEVTSYGQVIPFDNSTSFVHKANITMTTNTDLQGSSFKGWILKMVIKDAEGHVKYAPIISPVESEEKPEATWNDMSGAMVGGNTVQYYLENNGDWVEYTKE